MAALAPPDLQTRIVCSISAAQSFGLPPSVVLAVAQIEGGRPGLTRRNANGTYDLGPMQLNTAWLAELRPYGVNPRWALASGCYPYHLAAWRIRGHLLHPRRQLSFTNARGERALPGPGDHQRWALGGLAAAVAGRSAAGSRRRRRSMMAIFEGRRAAD